MAAVESPPPQENGSAPAVGTGDKNYDPAVVSRSVVEPADYASIPSVDPAFTLFVSGAADGMLPWGRAPKMRDRQLRDFIPSENWFASALATVVARNSAFSWALSGPDRTVKAAQEMLLNANRGDGWESFVAQVSLDLYTQDSGAFIEIIRTADSPSAPCINVAHLDAARCYPTGKPDQPVIYQDRKGKLHLMPWYSVVQLRELPAAIEHQHAGVFYKLQYCATTRLLRAAQILRSLSIYKDEKLAGRFVKAVHILRGVSVKQVTDALTLQNLEADQQGLLRYMLPLMVASVDPKADIGHETIELASLPENYNEDETMKWYVAALALAFLTDYQEFAPLPGGGLGTATQAQTLHMKSRGKGPGLFQSLMTHMMNFRGILPQNVEFLWDEQDIEADKLQAELEVSRATARKTAIDSGEIDAQAAREKALAAGDLTQQQFDDLMVRDKAKEAQAKLDRAAQAEAAARLAANPPPGGGDPNVAPGQQGEPTQLDSNSPGSAGAPGITTVNDANAAKATTAPERLAVEEHVTGELEEALGIAMDGLRKRLVSPAQKSAKPPRRRVTTTFKKDGAGRTVQTVQDETWL